MYEQPLAACGSVAHCQGVGSLLLPGEERLDVHRTRLDKVDQRLHRRVIFRSEPNVQSPGSI